MNQDEHKMHVSVHNNRCLYQPLFHLTGSTRYNTNYNNTITHPDSSKTLALYKSCTYLLTYLRNDSSSKKEQRM